MERYRLEAEQLLSGVVLKSEILITGARNTGGGWVVEATGLVAVGGRKILEVTGTVNEVRRAVTSAINTILEEPER